MKNNRKIRIFALVTALLMMVLCLGVSATDQTLPPEEVETETATEAATEASGKLDQNMSGADMTFAERLEYALQGTATGMLMVFAVLTLLWLIVALTGKILGPKSEKEKEKPAEKVPAKPVTPVVTAPAAAPAAPALQDDGELAAVITAAIAAMLESGDYKNEFVGGFRVVSFKRSSTGAWNRK